MMPQDIDILASRLNFDVIAFRGNTRQEMIFIGLISWISTAIILGILAKWLIGLFMLGIGLSFPVSIAVGWCLATIMQKFKAGKPKGYVKQKLLLFLEKQGIKKSPFIRYTGKWSIYRSL